MTLLFSFHFSIFQKTKLAKPPLKLSTFCFFQKSLKHQHFQTPKSYENQGSSEIKKLKSSKNTSKSGSIRVVTRFTTVLSHLFLPSTGERQKNGCVFSARHALNNVLGMAGFTETELCGPTQESIPTVRFSSTSTHVVMHKLLSS